MRAFTEDEDPRVGRVVTGHFRTFHGYGVRRTTGSSSWLMGLTLGGEGTVGGQSLREGGFFLFRPGTPHDYRAAEGEEGWEFLWAHFHPWSHWTPWLDQGGLVIRDLRGQRDHAAIRARFAEANRRMSRPAENRELMAMNALEEVLLRTMYPRDAPRPIDARAEAAADYIRSHLREPLGVEDLARELSLSPSRLAHLFREAHGVPLRTFVEQVRLQRASELLQMTPMKVGEIAEEVGFPNVFYFSLRFRKAFGIPPTDFRKKDATGSWS